MDGFFYGSEEVQYQVYIQHKFNIFQEIFKYLKKEGKLIFFFWSDPLSFTDADDPV